MWNVQSLTDPPQTVVSLSHGQVVISKVEGPEPTPVPKTAAAGPNPTLKLCRLGENAGIDPLQVADPWQSALTKHAVAMPAPSTGPLSHN